MGYAHLHEIHSLSLLMWVCGFLFLAIFLSFCTNFPQTWQHGADDVYVVVYVHISYFSLVVTLYKTNKPPICTTAVRFVDYNENDDYFDGVGDNDTHTQKKTQPSI